MIYYHCSTPPIKVFGLPFFEETDSFERLPTKVMEQLPSLNFFGKRSVGGRVAFRTDSAHLSVILKLKTLSHDRCIPLVGSAGADLYLGKGKDARFWGTVFPENCDEQSKTVEKTFEKPAELEQVTLFLPRNEVIDSIQIGIDEGATIREPLPYTIQAPILFYGSSITEGGCASRVGNAYTALLSRWLDADIINYGFSGSAKGEPQLAEYIKTLTMSAFVMDYDHNANMDQLQQTHQPFFDIIRQAQPQLPIVLISRPDFYPEVEESVVNRQTIRNTYQTAIARGDKNVFFVDGAALFGTEERFDCTVDTVHPNDLGFMRMAKAIQPVLANILE